jgi:hypothetical protein
LKAFAIRCVQVKTSTNDLPKRPPREKRYHLLAIVKLVGAGKELQLDDSEVYLLKKEELDGCWDDVEPFELNEGRIEQLFS